MRLVGVSRPPGQGRQVDSRLGEQFIDHLPESKYALQGLGPVTDRLVKAASQLALTDSQRRAKIGKAGPAGGKQTDGLAHKSIRRTGGDELRGQPRYLFKGLIWGQVSRKLAGQGWEAID